MRAQGCAQSVSKAQGNEPSLMSERPYSIAALLILHSFNILFILFFPLALMGANEYLFLYGEKAKIKKEKDHRRILRQAKLSVIQILSVI